MSEGTKSWTHDDGYVLPLVLVAILIVAAIAAGTMVTVSRSAAAMASLQDDVAAERALLSAEADASYVYLTSPAVAGGVYTGPPSTYTVDFDQTDFAIPRSQWTSSLMWPARSGVRVAAYGGVRVRIAYQDASGLMPLNTANAQGVALLTSKLGLDVDEADLMAVLRDYMDDDHTRRFRGAERSDYRLRGLEGPANSPLRSQSEILAMPVWRDAMTSQQFNRFRQLTTTALIPVINPSLAHPAWSRSELEGLYADDRDSEFFGGNSLPPIPQATARFTLWVEGAGFARSFEIERTNGLFPYPFVTGNRFEIPTTDLLVVSSEQNEDLVPVLAPVPDGD